MRRQAVESGGVDLVLLDLAFRTATGSRHSSDCSAHGRDLPILVLSGMDDESLALRMVHAGAQDYLVKGKFDGALLLRAMRYAIERNSAEQELAQEKNPASCAPGGAAGPHFLQGPRKPVPAGESARWPRFSNWSGPRMLIGKTDFDFFMPEHAEQAFADEREIMRTGQPIMARWRRRRCRTGVSAGR